MDDAPVLDWQQLSTEMRAALRGKLENLYGHGSDAEAFNALAIDKQRALMIFVRRLGEKKLWDAVRRIENVYGVGGVGMNFTAWPPLAANLRARQDFTRMFAAHRGCAGGFRERRRTHAALHFLYVDNRHECYWSVHFDIHNPVASPASAAKHLLYEKLRASTPDWRMIEGYLADHVRWLLKGARDGDGWCAASTFYLQ